MNRRVGMRNEKRLHPAEKDGAAVNLLRGSSDPIYTRDFANSLSGQDSAPPAIVSTLGGVALSGCGRSALPSSAHRVRWFTLAGLYVANCLALTSRKVVNIDQCTELKAATMGHHRPEPGFYR